MAKRIQDFRKFNSSSENTVSTNNKKNVGAGPVSARKKIRASSAKTNKKEKNIQPKSTTSKFTTVFLILLIIIGIGVGCLFSPTFNLTQISASDGINVKSEEILNTFNIQKGTNVFKIDYKNIEKSIEKLPYIQSANANLILPSEIKIEYMEREPFALIKYLESYLVMDKYGYILEIIRDKKFENLPIIYNIEFDTYEIGKQLDDTAKTKYNNVVYLLENALKNNFPYSISEINYESISNVKMWVAEEDVEIIYGEIDKNIIIDKLNYIAGILIKVKGKSGRLDVSSSDYLEKTVFTERF